MSITYYVYELIDPKDNTPFYVGKGTKHTQYSRLKEHIKDTQYALDGKINLTHKFRKISKIKESGKEPILKIRYESLNHDEIIKKEIELIAFYGRKDIGTGILCNHTNGGDGMPGYKHTEAHKKSLRENNKGGQATAIPVAQICIETGNIIKFHKSARQAGLLLTNKKEAKANICAACKNKNVAPYGFYWRYIDDTDISSGKLMDIDNLNKWRFSGKSSKSVIQLDDNHNQIKVWESASEACRSLNKHIGSINRALKDGTKAQGFYWKYN